MGSQPMLRVRRGGPQGEGAREGRAYVLACVSGSAHAGVRGHGDKGSGRGGLVSCGYVAELVVLGSWFAAITAF